MERVIVETEENCETIETLKRVIRLRKPEWDEEQVESEARAIWLDVYA